jgi:hypothetical protein
MSPKQQMDRWYQKFECAREAYNDILQILLELWITTGHLGLDPHLESTIQSATKMMNVVQNLVTKVPAWEPRVIAIGATLIPQ